jgi:molecular chaperone GrpE
MTENKKNETNLRSRAMTLTIKAVIINEKSEVLLLRRSKNNKYSIGKFDLPGGHIEEHEGLEDSILREIKEETGMDVFFGEIIDVVEFPEGSQMFRDEKRGIRCICYSNSSEVSLSDEHDEFVWLSFEKALEKLSAEDGFESEKRNTVVKARDYLEMKNSLEGWKRCRADFENFKKRQMEERKEILAFSNINLIGEILPVLDNFHASTQHIPTDQKENAWVTGIMYIQKQLTKVLEDNGVKEIEVKIGDKFDPMTMEALKEKECDEKDCKNIVKRIATKGYRLGDKVIRPARVIVE